MVKEEVDENKDDKNGESDVALYCVASCAGKCM